MEFLDNTSREIYNNLVDFNKNSDYESLVKAIELNGVTADRMYRQRIEIEKQLKAGKKLVLYGLGADANRYLMDEKKHKNSMEYNYITWFGDIDWYRYCDKTVKEFNGKEVVTVEELLEEEGEYVFYIAASTQILEITKYLVSCGVDVNNIYQFRYYGTEVYDEKQYIDSFLEVKDEDIVIDAGAYTCDFTERFINWNKGKYKRIYAFEPDKENYDIAVKNMEQYENVEVVNSAVGEVSTSVSFMSKEGAGSGINENGNSTVEVVALDDMNLDKVSFIKLDVEGFELDTLKGGINTIKKYRPRMAICLYHKINDIIDIPKFIEELDLGYKYYLRIYSNTYLEIVLYCI